jgi:hypothetical protein
MYKSSAIRQRYAGLLKKAIAGVMAVLPVLGQAQTKQSMLGDSVVFTMRQRSAFDTTYYKSYDKEITARAFIAHKYTRLILTEPSGTLKYRPNTPPNIGIGATYRFLTINLSAGLGFFAPPGDKGKTHYVDLQTHFYWRTLSVDLFGQFYRGYYIPEGSFAGQQEEYSRPDVQVSFVGASAYYVVNFRHFSNRAYLIQDEWQQRSAGSLLLGLGIYYGRIRADSALAPSRIREDSTRYNIQSAHYFQMGPGIGYAYSLVFKRHYFLTGGATVAAALGHNREYGNESADRFGVTPIITYRLAAGYNGSVWGANVSWVNNQSSVSGVYSSQAYRIKTGVYQVTLTKRLGLSARARRKLNAIPEEVKDAVTP